MQHASGSRLSSQQVSNMSKTTSEENGYRRSAPLAGGLQAAEAGTEPSTTGINLASHKERDS